MRVTGSDRGRRSATGLLPQAALRDGPSVLSKIEVGSQVLYAHVNQSLDTAAHRERRWLVVC